MVTGFWSRTQRLISEIIGRSGPVLNINFKRLTPTRDATRPNYEYYDRARRCDGSVRGLEIAGLFLSPLASKTATWTLGQVPKIKMESEPLQEKVMEWFEEHHDEILQAYGEAVALGDYYIVVNPDLSITTITPDIVTPIVAEDDYSQTIGWRIEQRFQHPTEPSRYMHVVNEYTINERIQRVQFDSGPEALPERFSNPFGVVPVIHIPNNRESNEVYGKPDAAALLNHANGLLMRYDEVLQAALDGNILNGRSTPVAKFTDVQAMQAFYDANSTSKTQTVYDPITGEKRTETTRYIDFNSDMFMGVVGDFKYASPGQFAGDTEKLLAILYWLFLEHVEIPEFVMGTAVTASKASTETQMPIFERWVKKKRGEAKGWMLELIEVVATYTSAVTPAAGAVGKISLMWDSLTDTDGMLTLQTIQWALAEGLLDRETALMLAPIDIEDIGAVLAAAKAEREENQNDMLDQAQAALMRQEAQAELPQPDNVVPMERSA